MCAFPSKSAGRALDWAFPLVAAAAVALVLATFVRTWVPGSGITRMITIGPVYEECGTAAFRGTPKYVDPYPGDRRGFDGQMYAELSLDPLLRDPELARALDDPPYRAHRIFLPWLAWICGLGRPVWILNAYAALNGVFWLGLVAILIGLFRPLGWPGLAGFAAMLLTCGVVQSIYHSLTDLPAFVLLAWAAMVGGAPSGILLGLSGLTREVYLIGFLGLAELKPPWGAAARRNLLLGLLSGLPVLLWFAYVAGRFPAHPSTAGGNLDWPLHAIFLRLQRALSAVRRGGLLWPDLFQRDTEAHALLTIVATLTQCLYVVTHPMSANRFWRIGVAFVPLFLCISSNVWEFGYFDVARHALPITLAFNLVLAMRPRRWWAAWFIFGNCFAPAAIADFVQFGQTVWPHAEFRVESPHRLDDQISVRPGRGWAELEYNKAHTWRWAIDSNADLVLDNTTGRAVGMQIVFGTQSLLPRTLEVAAGRRPIWLSRRILATPPAVQWVRTSAFVLPPGETHVVFSSPQPPAPSGHGDLRTLSFMLYDVTLVASPPP